MKTDSLAARNAQKQHVQEMRNLNADQTNELNKLKSLHETRKAMQLSDQRQELVNLNHEHDMKVESEISRQEDILNKLQKSLQETKELTEAEKQKIVNDNEVKKEELKQKFETDYSINELHNQYIIKEQNEDVNRELKQMNKEFQAEKHNLLEKNIDESKGTEELHESKLAITKDMYNRQQDHQTVKYSKSLMDQQRKNTSHLRENEQRFQKNFNIRQQNNQEKFNALESEAKTKQLEAAKHFEHEYNGLMAKNEKTLQHLLARKEKVLNSLQQYLWKNYQLGIEKSKDPFYDFGKLNIQTKALPDGYELKVPLAEHEAKNLNMVAEKRELKFSFTRSHNEDQNTEEGQRNIVKKSESYVTRIPVENIIDSKTITKDYRDGHVVFNIKNA